MVSTSRYFVPTGTPLRPEATVFVSSLRDRSASWHKSVVPALRLARSLSDETWLLTSTDVGAISGVDRVFSRLPPDETADVYRSCDILLKLSLIEGFGLPPLEMFHCGGTVVGFDGPSTAITEYAEHGRDCLLAPAPTIQGRRGASRGVAQRPSPAGHSEIRSPRDGSRLAESVGGWRTVSQRP